MSQERSPYFRSADDAAPFRSDGMGKADLLSTDRFVCGVHAFEAGQRHEPHAHEDSDKLYVVLRGRGTFVVGDERRILGRGEVAFAPAGVSHGVSADGGERLLVLAFLFPAIAAPAAAAAPPAVEAPPPGMEIPSARPPEIPPSRPPVIPQRQPVEAPVETAPVAREPEAPASRPRRPGAPTVPGIPRISGGKLVAGEAQPVEPPPEIPTSTRGVPVRPRGLRRPPATPEERPPERPPEIPTSARGAPVIPRELRGGPAPSDERPAERPPEIPISRGASILPPGLRGRASPPPSEIPSPPPDHLAAPPPERPPEIPTSSRGAPVLPRGLHGGPAPSDERPPERPPEISTSRGASILPPGLRGRASPPPTEVPAPPPDRLAAPPPVVHPTPPRSTPRGPVGEPSMREMAGDSFEARFESVAGDRLVLRPDDLADPVLVLPATGEAARTSLGPARVILETAGRTFRRTMGTARAVQTRQGEPVRYTGIVTRLDPAQGVLVVDVGFPVVARDLGGHAFESLTPGSGVTFDAEGPTRVHVLT